MRPKVSVIVPVYKVETYIERCTRSLMEQTLKEMEFIFVDDGSPDNSMDIVRRIVREYPWREGQVILMSNEKNRGLLQTRIHGFAYASGEYLGTVDSDDWVEPNMYENLYGQIVKEKAECVVFGYKRDFAHYSESCQRAFPYALGRELVENIYRFPFEFFVWGTMLKKNDRFMGIINQYIDAPEWENVTMWEDVAIMLPYYYGVQRLAYSPHCFYHYNKTNESSAVSSQNKEKVYQALQVVDYLRETMKAPELDMAFHCLAFGAKGALLDIKGVRAWRKEHKEANRYIMKFTSIPLRVRLLLYAAAHGISFPYYGQKMLKKLLRWRNA